MPIEIRQVTLEDIIPLEDYVNLRCKKRQEMFSLKKHRRIEVGSYAAFYFENYFTILSQIQEMLYIEKGGEEQLSDELTAYNPLIPQGKELTATLMFEIDDPIRRLSTLRRLTHIELTAYIDIAGDQVMSVPEQDVDRTAEDGKTSAVHFLHFPFQSKQIEQFKDLSIPVILGFSHENYAHMTVLSEETRCSLIKDFI